MTNALPAQHLSTRLKAGGAFGQVIDSMVNHSLGVFLLFYVTVVNGLSGALAGLAIAIGLVVDAVMDPFIGSLSDGWRSRLGRRVPFMLVGAPGVAVMLVLIFSLPMRLGTIPLFLYVTLVSILLRVSISLFVLPYQATLPELTQDYAERSSILVWRWTVGMCGSMAALLLGLGYFFAGPGGIANRAAYTPFAITVAAIALVAGLVAIRTTYLTRDRAHAAPPAEGQAHQRLVRDLFEVFRSRSFRAIFFSTLLLYTGIGTHTALGLHANTYFWHLTPPQIQVVTLSIYLGLLIGAPLLVPVMKVVEKRTLAMAGLVGMGIVFSVPSLLRLLGLFPFEGDSLVAVLGVLLFVAGVMTAGAAVSFGSMMADAADEHEHLFGSRREGVYYAGQAFASKAASGAGTLVAGLVLTLVDFPTKITSAPAAATVVPGDVVRHLAWFYGPGVGLIFLGSLLVLRTYLLTRQGHGRILLEIAARRVPAKGVPSA